MTADEARAMYRDQLDLHGEDIAIRRYTGTGTDRTHVDRPCRARVMGSTGTPELVGSVIQREHKIIVLAEDLEGESPAFTVKVGDKALVRDKELSIVSLDDSSCRIGVTLIAYEFTARG